MYENCFNNKQMKIYSNICTKWNERPFAYLSQHLRTCIDSKGKSLQTTSNNSNKIGNFAPIKKGLSM